MNSLDLTIFGVAGVAAYFDVKYRKIPNWLVLFGMVSGLVLNSLAGTDLLIHSALGLTIGIAVLIIPFAFGWMGAGDVKMFGSIGAMLGVGLLPRVFFYSALFAGVIAVFYSGRRIAKSGVVKEFCNNLRLAVFSFGRILPFRRVLSLEASDRAVTVPWGVAFAGGMILAYYVDPVGSFAGF